MTGTAYCPSDELHLVIELTPVRDAEEDDVLSSDPLNKVIDFGDDALAENDVSNRCSLRSKGARAPNYTYDDDDDDDDGFHDDNDDEDSDKDWFSSAIFDDDDDDDSVAAGRYRVPSARGKGAGRIASDGRPPKPNTEGTSAEAAPETIAAWKLD